MLNPEKDLCHLADRFIKIPYRRGDQKHNDKLETKQRFPGILGAVGDCHIPIKAPRKNHEQYINRNGFHSVQLQVVCNMDMYFTDVFCGYPGSVYDARVLRNSPLHHDAVVDVDQLFPGNTHVTGDAAYPLKSWLLTLSRDNGRLTRRQLRYNCVHSSTRIVVERLLALLKGRFRKLKTTMDIDNTEDIPEIVTASCVSHNVCLMSNEEVEDFLDDGDSDDDDDDDDDDDKDYDDTFPPEAEGNDKTGKIMLAVSSTFASV